MQAREEAHSKLKTLFQEQQTAKQKEEEQDHTFQRQQKVMEDTYRELEEKMDSMKSENLKLSYERSSLQAQLVEQVESSTLQVKQLENGKMAAESKFAELLKKAKKLQSEVKDWREKQVALGSLEDEVRSLVEEKDAMTNQVATLRGELESVERGCKSREDSLKKELDGANSRCVESERSLAESLGRNETVNEELEVVKSACTDLEQGLATSQTEEEILREEVRELLLKHSNNPTTSQATEDATKEAMDAQLSRMEASLADAARKEVTLREEVAEVELKYTRLEQSLTSKEKSCEALEVEVSMLKSNFSKVEKALIDERHEKESLSEASEQLRESTLQSCRRAGELQEECQQLSNELQATQGTRDKISSELVDTKEKLDQSCVDLDKAMAHSRTQLAEMESRVLELDSDLEKALCRLEESRQKVDELTDTRKSDEARFKCELAQALSHRSEVEEELHVKEECSQKRTSELEQSLQEMGEKLKVADKDIVSLQSTQDLFSKEKEANQEQIESLTSEVAELQDRLGSVEHGDGENADDSAGIRAQLVSLQEQNRQLCRECEEVKKENLDVVEGLRRERGEAKAEVEKAGRVLVEQVQQARDLREKEVSSLREENKKLKAFALKLKKELSDTRETVSVVTM